MEWHQWIVLSIRGILLGLLPYSILLLILKRSGRLSPDFLKEFDTLACSIVAYSGIILALVTLVTLMQAPDWNALQRWAISGFMQISVWVVATQLLWIEYLRKRLWYRAIISLCAFVTLERLIIYLTSLHRDYLPSSWVLYIGPWEVFAHLLLSTIGIILITSLVYRIKKTNTKTFDSKA